MREVEYLDRGWLYSPTWMDAYKTSIMPEGEEVSLPHSVAVTPYSYFDGSIYQKVSSYQKILTMPPAWEKKTILITFEGAAHRAEVYLNGKEVGDHACGYTPFTIDLTGKMKTGENLLTVRLDSRETLDQPPFGFVIDYMTYGGLYREAYLTVKDPLSIEDVFYQPKPLFSWDEKTFEKEGKEERGRGTLTSDIVLSPQALSHISDGDLLIRQTLFDRVILSEKLTPSLIDGEEDLPGGIGLKRPPHISIKCEVRDVPLWDIDDPATCPVVTELIRSGEVLDRTEERIGFRTMEWKLDGFYLNGRRVFIRGLNRHQSFPYVGYAMPESMQREDARILKEELGVNTVRTSHYPDSPYFYDECDKLGLLVFTEIPGWQHIGGEAWKDQAVRNTFDMILPLRNHPSIMIWGVRINESKDDDEFYHRTNDLAHALDPTRSTGGVRNETAGKDTLIEEDVFTYNDFSHDGKAKGCISKKKATHGSDKPYLITEHNGHMFPTKAFDPEDHRTGQVRRHAAVIDCAMGEGDIAGAIGWCMADYNTHKDFGSGDRICYHGVLDMFRNPKPAAGVYQAEGGKEDFLSVTSTMDIGEHPASNRGETYILTNADSVRMYKGERLLKEYFPEDSSFHHLNHPPILVDDYVGNQLVTEEGLPKRQAALVKSLLNSWSMNGGRMTLPMILKGLFLMAFYHMKKETIVSFYQKYIGNWGGEAAEFRFDAIRKKEVVSSVLKTAVKEVWIEADLSADSLVEERTYDVVAIRIRATDQNGNILPFFNEPLAIRTEGPVEIIGPDQTAFRGGLAGTFVRSIGKSGKAVVSLKTPDAEEKVLSIRVEA